MNKKTILPLAITLALALNASAHTPADTRHTAAWSMHLELHLHLARGQCMHCAVWTCEQT